MQRWGRGEGWCIDGRGGGPWKEKSTEPQLAFGSHWREGRHPLGINLKVPGAESNSPLAQRAMLTHLTQMFEKGYLSFLVGFLFGDFKQSHLGFFSTYIFPHGFPYPTIFLSLA